MSVRFAVAMWSRTAMTVLIAVLFVGVTSVANGESSIAYFKLRDVGMMNPDPPMTLDVANDTVSYYARGRDVGVFPESRYTGIGKYVLSVDETTRRQIDALKRALSSRTFPTTHPPGGATILEFSFDNHGRHYDGEYRYEADSAFNTRLYPFYEIADRVLKDGRAEIHLHPAFSVRAGTDGFIVDLTFGNEGQKEVSVAGPDTWSADLNRPDKRHVQIGAIDAAGTCFDVRLVSRYLNDDAARRHYGEAIAIKPGEAVTLTFQIPYSAVTFEGASTSRRIVPGRYRFTGQMNVDVLAPAEMAGKIATPMDEVRAVELRESTGQ